MEKKLSVLDSLGWGLAIVVTHIVSFALPTFIFLAILAIVHGVFFNELSLIPYSFYFIDGILLTAMNLYFIQLSLAFYDQKVDSTQVLFSSILRLPRVIITDFLYTIIVVIGFVLLIIPGFFWHVRFAFFPAFIVDQNRGIIQSLRESYRLTKGCFWRLWFLFLLLSPSLWLAGSTLMKENFLYFFMVTSFLFTPIYAAATVHVYRSMLGEK